MASKNARPGRANLGLQRSELLRSAARASAPARLGSPRRGASDGRAARRRQTGVDLQAHCEIAPRGAAPVPSGWRFSRQRGRRTSRTVSDVGLYRRRPGHTEPGDTTTCRPSGTDVLGWLWHRPRKGCRGRDSPHHRRLRRLACRWGGDDLGGRGSAAARRGTGRVVGPGSTGVAATSRSGRRDPATGSVCGVRR